jgi:hypothetical protein
MKEKKIELQFHEEDVAPDSITLYDLYVLLMEQNEEIAEILEMIVALPKTYRIWDEERIVTVQGEQTK